MAKEKPKTEQNIEPITVTVAQARKLTGISTSTIYRMFDAGTLSRKKLGGRTLILMSELRQLLENLPEAA